LNNIYQLFYSQEGDKLFAKSYEDLEIYKNAFKFAVQIHELTLKFPKFELYEEGSQLRRSSKSIIMNIVEGYGRKRYKKEFIKFLTYALSSSDETKEHLKIAFTFNYISNKLFEQYYDGYDQLGRQIYNFIKTYE
jgi:four helix bundle protein